MFKFLALVATASALTLTKNSTAAPLPYGQTDYGVAEGTTQHAVTTGKW